VTLIGEEVPKTYRKNAMRERERSSPGEREEANIERKTAGVTGIRLVWRGLVDPPALVPEPKFVLACALDMESGYGRCDATGGVETVGWCDAAAYEAGVIVLVLGVDVGVRLEPALERTDGDGEPTIAYKNRYWEAGGSEPNLRFAGRLTIDIISVFPEYFRVISCGVTLALRTTAIYDSCMPTWGAFL
jgi:hypothetical protein